MARRGRGEIGKVDFRPAMGASPKASSMRRNPSLGVVQKDDAATSSPAAGASNSNQAMRPLSPGRHFSFPNKAGGFGGSDDEEEAAQAFDAALALSAEDGSDVSVAAVRALFATAVQRAVDAKERRDSLEDRCNQEAAENEALASELRKNRAKSSSAQISKISAETMCREKAHLHHLAVEEAKMAAAAEETDSAEVREKLEVTLPDIKKQLEGEAERLKKLSEENEALRNHLAGLAEKAQLSAESLSMELHRGYLRIQLMKAKCNRQEGERKIRDSGIDILSKQLECAKASLASAKSKAAEQERSYSNIESMFDESKKTVEALEAKCENLTTVKATIQEELPIYDEAIRGEETVKSLEKVVDRLRNVCDQLESDVETKRSELRELITARKATAS